MAKKTIFLILALFLIAGGLLYVALYPRDEAVAPTTTPTTPTPTPAAQTKLMLIPNPVVMATTSASVQVNIDTSINAVTAVQLELSYDPKALTNVDIASPSANGFFQNPIVLLKNIDRVQGKISYALGIRPLDHGISGTGTVATITFRKLLTTGQTALTVLPQTQVTAEGVMGNVLKESLGTTIMLSSTPSTRSAAPAQ